MLIGFGVALILSGCSSSSSSDSGDGNQTDKLTIKTVELK